MPTHMYPSYLQKAEEFERLYLQPDERIFKTFKIRMLPIIAQAVKIHNDQASDNSEKFRIINKVKEGSDEGFGFTIISKVNCSISAKDLFEKLKNTLLIYHEKRYSPKTRQSFEGLTIEDIREFHKCQNNLYKIILEMNDKCPMPITSDMLDTLNEVISLGEEIINTYASLDFDE